MEARILLQDVLDSLASNLGAHVRGDTDGEHEGGVRAKHVA
jgi:hypothetical protein